MLSKLSKAKQSLQNRVGYQEEEEEEEGYHFNATGTHATMVPSDLPSVNFHTGYLSESTWGIPHIWVGHTYPYMGRWVGR
eukprot:4007063-Prymnesium_polylepis.1